MTNTLTAVQSTPFVGLNTFTYTVTTAGIYTVDCEATIPNEQGTSANTNSAQPVQSQLQIVIALNGTPALTVGGSAANPTPTQGTLGARTHLSCAVADVITVVTSSSAAVDVALNAVKGTVNLYLGL